MQEYLGEAIVLSREPVGELDVRFSVFTKRFGKLEAKAKSARRITSKLAGHLEPGNLIDARIVEKNGLHIADALKKRRLNVELADLRQLGAILAEAEPEPRLWRELSSGKLNWGVVLGILGWDPRAARCQACGGTKDGLVFSVRGQEFFCGECSSKLDRNEVIYIKTS